MRLDENLHTHTFRCGHATGEDRAYVVDDVKRDEYVCRVLEDERTMQHHELDNSHVVWTDERGQGFGQEEVDIMSAYTHPALNQVVIGSNI